MSTFAIKVDTASLDALIDGMNADVQAAARPAAQAAAQVLYDAVRANVSRIKRRTGNLSSSIYQAYSRDNSGRGREVYHVSWNARKAPHGHLVEFGHLQRYEVSYDSQTRRFTTHKDRPLPAPVQVAARPFIRPAMTRFDAAMAAARERLLTELQEKGVVR